MLGLKKGKKTGHQIEAIIQEGEAEVKLEIATTDEIKVKASKGLYFHQKITKTEAQEVKPRIIVKKHNQNKRNIFPKGRTTSEKFETIVITTNGIIKMLDSLRKNIMKYTLFLRHNLIKTAKVKMCK